MEAVGRLTSASLRWLLGGAALLAMILVGCSVGPPAPTAAEVALRATIESLRDDLTAVRTPAPATTPTPTPRPTLDETGSPVPARSPSPVIARGPDSRLLNWQPVKEKTQVGDLELTVDSLLLGQDSYGGGYGSSIAAGPDTKIVLADLTLGYNFRPGRSPYEVHVDFFVIADQRGLEYRGLPVPASMGNALPDRFFLSSGQAYRGVMAFIVPRDLNAGRLYYTNFLDVKEPPDRLTIALSEIPMPQPRAAGAVGAVLSAGGVSELARDDRVSGPGVPAPV
jgi:hypothetical protein